jgi:mannose-6-phosphate isomerase-like protein (cupin superfamily)
MTKGSAGLVVTGTIVLGLAATAPARLGAADAPGVVVWTSAELKGYAQKLAPKVDAGKFSSERLASYGNHYMLIAHREGDGTAEVHEKEADIFVVQSGAATLAFGGELVGGHTTAPGEIRGPSIKGGEKRPLAAGDVVHIPAGVPHQLSLPKGEFTYFVVKVQGQ